MGTKGKGIVCKLDGGDEVYRKRNEVASANEEHMVS